VIRGGLCHIADNRHKWMDSGRFLPRHTAKAEVIYFFPEKTFGLAEACAISSEVHAKLRVGNRC
jgi:hypothetical protein